MRARRGLVVGWLVVGIYAGALVAAAAGTRDGPLEPGDRPSDGRAASAFVEAWDRSLSATFVRVGTFARRSEVTGAEISSEDVLAQRPPDRIHRQLGGVSGRADDRLVVCPAPPEGETAEPCRLGAPDGITYAQDATSEVAGLHSLVSGVDPLYAVEADEAGTCFTLVQQRPDPRGPFGVEARFCFHPATGAPADSTVRYAGGIVETVTVSEVRADVSDRDLRP